MVKVKKGEVSTLLTTNGVSRSKEPRLGLRELCRRTDIYFVPESGPMCLMNPSKILSVRTQGRGLFNLLVEILLPKVLFFIKFSKGPLRFPVGDYSG